MLRNVRLHQLEIKFSKNVISILIIVILNFSQKNKEQIIMAVRIQYRVIVLGVWVRFLFELFFIIYIGVSVKPFSNMYKYYI